MHAVVISQRRGFLFFSYMVEPQGCFGGLEMLIHKIRTNNHVIWLLLRKGGGAAYVFFSV